MQYDDIKFDIVAPNFKELMVQHRDELEGYLAGNVIIVYTLQGCAVLNMEEFNHMSRGCKLDCTSADIATLRTMMTTNNTWQIYYFFFFDVELGWKPCAIDITKICSKQCNSFDEALECIQKMDDEAILSALDEAFVSFSQSKFTSM